MDPVDSEAALADLTRKVAGLTKQVADLNKRVDGLNADMMEHKQLNRRVADLTDVVSQLLLPGSSEEQFRARLAAYLDSLEGGPVAPPTASGESR